MIITPYKQTTWATCLPVCLFLLAGQKISPQREIELLINGTKKLRDSYALGIIDYFVTKYGFKAKIFVDNRYFYNYLKKNNKNQRIGLLHKKIEATLLHKQPKPYILYIDNHLLGPHCHSPHFVIVESQLDRKFSIIDPWYGKRKRLKKEIIYSALNSLKKRLRFCPLLISLKRLS